MSLYNIQHIHKQNNHVMDDNIYDLSTTTRYVDEFFEEARQIKISVKHGIFEKNRSKTIGIINFLKPNFYYDIFFKSNLNITLVTHFHNRPINNVFMKCFPVNEPGSSYITSYESYEKTEFGNDLSGDLIMYFRKNDSKESDRKIDRGDDFWYFSRHKTIQFFNSGTTTFLKYIGVSMQVMNENMIPKTITCLLHSTSPASSKKYECIFDVYKYDLYSSMFMHVILVINSIIDVDLKNSISFTRKCTHCSKFPKHQSIIENRLRNLCTHSCEMLINNIIEMLDGDSKMVIDMSSIEKIFGRSEIGVHTNYRYGYC